VVGFRPACSGDDNPITSATQTYGQASCRFNGERTPWALYGKGLISAVRENPLWPGPGAGLPLADQPFPRPGCGSGEVVDQ